MWNAIIYSTVAGVVGTALGGVLGLILGKKKNSAGKLMFFSGGFMIGIVAFELIKEALSFSNLINLILSFTLGVVFVALFSDKVERKQESKTKGNSMLIVGITIFAGIALHNLPEGLAVGSGATQDFGITIALLIALHNIPEGAAMALPLHQGGFSKSKALAFCALSGVPTVVGAIVGSLVSSISPHFIASCLGVAAGAMIHITFSEILPSGSSASVKKTDGLFMTIGFLLALFLVEVL